MSGYGDMERSGISYEKRFFSFRKVVKIFGSEIVAMLRDLSKMTIAQRLTEKGCRLAKQARERMFLRSKALCKAGKFSGSIELELFLFNFPSGEDGGMETEIFLMLCEAAKREIQNAKSLKHLERVAEVSDCSIEQAFIQKEEELQALN